MPIFEIEGPDGIYEVDAPDENAAVAGFQQAFGKVDPATNQPPGVPAFAPPGVEGYDPMSGNVTPQFGMGDSAAYGAADTATAGFGDEISSYLGSAISGKPREQVLSEMRGLQAQAQEQNPGSYLGGQVAGGVAQAVALGPASLAGRAAQGGGTLGRVALGSTAEGIALGGLYGAGSGEDAGDRIVGAGTGAIAGGVLGALSPYAVSGASNLFRRAISPFSIPAERQAAIATLRNEGVPLTAGQRTGSKALQFSESEIGGSRAADVMENQGRAFTRAAMRRAGQDTLADPDSMAALNRRLSQGFEDISARNTLRADQPMVADMNRAAQEYATVLPPEQKAIFTQLGDALVQRFKAGGGKMTGKDYQTQRSRLSRIAQSYRQRDPEFANAIRGLRNSLDDAMDRGINPQDAGAWRELRKQWGNKKTLENAIASAGGEDAGLGIISPARLRMAASSGNRGGFARGESDFTGLARAGQATMTPMPNSGTASRISARSLGVMAPTILGAGYGGVTGGDAQSAIAGAGAGYLLQKGAGAALMSRPVQAMLSNQVAAGSGNEQLRAAIARILLGGGNPQLVESLR